MTDTTTPPGAGHNQPPPYDPDAYEALDSRTREVADAAGDWLTRCADGVENDQQAGDLRDFIEQARGVAKEVAARKKVEKAPHLEAGRAVDAAFGLLMDRLEKSVKAVQKLAADYLARKQAEEEARLAAERERIRAEQAALAKAQAEADARIDLAGQAELERKAKDLAKAEKAAAKPAKAQMTSGSGGARAMSLRTQYRAEVQNVRVAMLYFQNRPEVADLIARLSEAEWRATKGTAKIPGVVKHEEKVAV